MIIILLMLQLAVLTFDSTEDTSQSSLMQANQTQQMNNGTALTSNSTTSLAIYNLVFDPVNWDNNGFIQLLITGLIVGSAIGIGASFFFKSDLTLLFPLFVALLGMGLIPIMSLYNIINRDVSLMACTVGEICSPSILLSSIICAPVAIYWIFVCLEWWSGRPTN